MQRRVNAIFGDAKVEDRYYEPQKMTDDTILDVRFIFFSIRNLLLFLCSF